MGLQETSEKMLEEPSILPEAAAHRPTPSLTGEDLDTADGLTPTSQPGRSTSEQTMGLQELLDGVLRGLQSSHTNMTPEPGWPAGAPAKTEPLRRLTWLPGDAFSSTMRRSRS